MQRTLLQLTESTERYQGKMSGVAYDTAWVARITDQRGKPLFPRCSQWLLENQYPDGSWGSHVVNFHDRILSTLSAITALREIHKNRYEDWIRKGEDYIWENLSNLKFDDCRLIGSELLLPSLMEQAESIGLNIPSHVRVYRAEQEAKLTKINESLWYSPRTTLSFSLEFMGESVDVKRLPYVQLANGSVANSPAATAFYLKHLKDQRAIEYLEQILSLTGDGSVMTVYPIDIFEFGWTLYYLLSAGLYLERYVEICDFLYKQMGPSGVGCSSASPLVDADDTAVVLKVLHEMGYPVDVRILDEYNAGEHYLTFDFELDPSVSTNIHILDFIRIYKEFPDRTEVIEKLLKFLSKNMCPDGYWIDKWHVSPYYPTGHAIIALCGLEQSLAEKAISWLLDTQNVNGTWGENGGTLEETSYAIQALMCYYQQGGQVDRESVSKALSAMSFKTSTPDLLADQWVGKVLYSPARVLWSSAASAQFMAEASNLKTPKLAQDWM
jgi:halimadienyl-diphosphate synthase